jgi:hypothetical protein
MDGANDPDIVSINAGKEDFMGTPPTKLSSTFVVNDLNCKI